MRSLVLCLLAAVMIALASLLTLACSSDGSEGDGVDWQSFTPVAPPGEEALNISDVERETGLRLALPSYLPEGMSKNLIVSVSEYNIGQAQYVGVRVTLYPTRRDGLGIYVDESKRKIGQPTPKPGVPRRAYPSRSEITKIGKIDVYCWDEVAQQPGFPTPAPSQPTEDPERYMIFKCGWETEDLSFDVRFVWGSPQPAPDEIAPEGREEAMKVIASMIEDPYSP